uniref:Uncharacterized protein n=1 Tax=Panagrolaimus sp. PS1159 TaxID=55785 RepID=A0AC35F044_9BILA
MASLLNNQDDGNAPTEHSSVKDALKNIFSDKDDEDKKQDGIHDYHDSSIGDANNEKFDYCNDETKKSNEIGNNPNDFFGKSNENDSDKIDVSIGSGGTYLSGSGDFNKN